MNRAYQKMLQQRKKEKVKLLKKLGIYNKEKKKPNLNKVRPCSKNKASNKIKVSPCQPERRSRRLLILNKQEDEKQNSPPIPKPRIIKDNFFGEIPSVPVGTIFSTRLEASRAGIHRPPVAGIHGNESRGCFSIALSGGYEDDIDKGDKFTYTGEGGRDLKGTKAKPKNLRTAKQSKDQVLERGNLALHLNFQKKLPVRVLRGYKLQSEFAPEEGYRYDGLYDVVKSYTEKGKAGFLVYKYKMVRRNDQAPGPWHVCPK